MSTITEKQSIGIYDSISALKNEIKVDFCDQVSYKRGLFLDEYANRIFDILTAKKSPVLITGGRGTGKTTLVQHLQYLINNYKCPKQFYETKIMELNMLSLSFGIKTISDYEERIINVFNNILDGSKNGEKYILFIDKFSDFVSGNNVNTLVHLYMEQGINENITMICCCGTNELKSLESKYDLMRHFTEVKIKEPLIEETKEIIKYKANDYLSDYKISIPEDISDKIVMLCDKYVKNNFCMPLKAIKVMDIAVAKHYNNVYKSNDTKKANEIIAIKDELTSMLSKKPNKNFIEIVNKNNQLNDLKNTLKNSVTVVKAEDTILTDDDVYSVVSDIAGVPITKLSESDASKLKNMIPSLASKVIGQDDTINKICKTVKRNRLGLRKKNHTIGNFMFIGSTGVGKTFLAKKLAEYMFGSEETLVRLDMSEYTDEISVNKLIGAPPGYVGYGEGGVLCNAIKRNPYSVILFDEIEKANPAVYNTILQLMDEGRITDSNGKHISATNNIIILTSNIGVKEAVNTGSAVGFACSKEESDKRNDSNRKSIIMNSMQRRFSPEFLNRIDCICYFNDLNKDNLECIFDNEIAEVINSVKEIGYKLKLSNDVKTYIVEKSEKEKMGARALIRNIQQDIVDEMTEMIINEESKKKNINVSLDKTKESIKIKIS